MRPTGRRLLIHGSGSRMRAGCALRYPSPLAPKQHKWKVSIPPVSLHHSGMRDVTASDLQYPSQSETPQRGARSLLPRTGPHQLDSIGEQQFMYARNSHPHSASPCIGRDQSIQVPQPRVSSEAGRSASQDFLPWRQGGAVSAHRSLGTMSVASWCQGSPHMAVRDSDPIPFSPKPLDLQYM